MAHQHPVMYIFVHYTLRRPRPQSGQCPAPARVPVQECCHPQQPLGPGGMDGGAGQPGAVGEVHGQQRGAWVGLALVLVQVLLLVVMVLMLAALLCKAAPLTSSVG